MSIPEGVKGWSWGAFFLNWIWAISNGVWVGLLALVPLVGFVMAIVLGFKGREWAWQARQWESVEQFQRVQYKWSAWALGILGVCLLIGTAGSIGTAYMEQRQADAVRAATEARRRLQAQAKPTAVAREAAWAADTAVAVAQAEPVQAAQGLPEDLLSQASRCEDTTACIRTLLQGALPRRPDVLQAALARIDRRSKPGRGDRKGAREYSRLALAQLDAGNYSAASDLFMQAVKLDPHDPEILSNLGFAQVGSGNGAEAVTTLLLALELDPRRSSAWVPLAEALESQQLSDEAVRALLLAYEYSGNKPKTIEFFRNRSTAPNTTEGQRTVYSQALGMAESGY